MDACPGRLNAINFFIKRDGTFYGQCSEICGIGHSFMPISIIVYPQSRSTRMETLPICPIKLVQPEVSKSDIVAPLSTLPEQALNVSQQEAQKNNLGSNVKHSSGVQTSLSHLIETTEKKQMEELKKRIISREDERPKREPYNEEQE
jgi:hypothetical protein